jgi:hypothetical protein
VFLATEFVDRGDGRREAVGAYVQDVNAIERRLAVELAAVQQAYERLRLDPDTLPKQVDDLERAEGTMRKLQARLDVLRPPSEAVRLHAALLRLVALQVGLAHETTQLGRFLPGFLSEKQKVTAATARLRRDLAGARTAAAQAPPFGRYARVLDDVASRVSALRSPPVLEPARTNDVARLRRLSTLAQGLRSALERGRSTDLERDFRALVRIASTSGATPAEREAVIAYNRRIEAIDRQRVVVQGEHSVLNREL